MLSSLLEFFLPFIISWMVHRHEKLTERELDAKNTFQAKLPSPPASQTKKPVIVAMVGLVGSGKSWIAKDLARQIGAIVVENDAIRVKLRERNKGYEQTRAIAEDLALEFAKHGGNVILDSDFIDPAKRASLRAKARKAGIPVIFIRTFCDFDIAEGRIREAESQDKSDRFFRGASSVWTGNNKAAIVKSRELWRRTPLHYRWSKKGGGQWLVRHLPFPILAEIDTSKEWKQGLKRCAQEIISRF